MKFILVSYLFVTFLLSGFAIFPHISKVYASSNEALKAMADEDWQRARALVSETKDPVLTALYQFLMYTNKSDYTGLPFQSIVNFLRAYPHWPDQDKIRMAAERNITNAIGADIVSNYFNQYPPLSGVGILAYAKILQNDEQIAAMLRSQFPKAEMSAQTQAEILRLYSKLIARDTHRQRLDYLLFEEENAKARAYATLIGNGYPALVEARLALRGQVNNADAYVARVPASLQNDSGLLYERLRFYRRGDRNGAAMQILQAQPKTALISNIEDWWKERNILARRMIEKRDYRTAYTLSANHGAMEGQEYSEAEWLSGWLALRFLKDPARGLAHFQAMHPRMKTAISKARAAYWSGRALEALGRQDEANKWFGYAMNFPKVYYGQLAAKHLKRGIVDPMPAVASADDVRRVQNSDLGRAIQMTHQAGLRGTRNKLIKAYGEYIQSAGEFKALAQMLTKMNLPQESLKIAKKAAQDNVFLKEEAYPIFPSYFEGINIDKALAHGLIRQESQFDVDVRSPAGALGLMQLMPATAREVAEKRGWDHKTEWLTSDPKHNVLLGSAFLNDLIRRYDGAYPMAMAAYNAGPGRVREWINEYGDPRTGAVDWVDWIELIPIYETRNYVQRVSESYIVYREQRGVR